MNKAETNIFGSLCDSYDGHWTGVPGKHELRGMDAKAKCESNPLNYGG